MKWIDRAMARLLVGVAAYCFFHMRFQNAIASLAMAAAFTICLFEGAKRLWKGPADREKRRSRDRADARNTVRRLCLLEHAEAFAFLETLLAAEFAPVDIECAGEGLVCRKDGKTVYVHLLTAPYSASAGDADVAAAYRGMRRAGADKALLIATCRVGKLSAADTPQSVRVWDGETLAGVCVRQPQCIDRSAGSADANSARSAKLRALWKTLAEPPGPRQQALSLGYAALLLISWRITNNALAFLCMILQLARALYGFLRARGRGTARARLF